MKNPDSNQSKLIKPLMNIAFCSMLTALAGMYTPTVVAQTNDNTQTVEVKVAGTLRQLISDSDKFKIKRLKVSGTLNGNDVKMLREMAGKDSEGNATEGTLTELDLTDVQLTDGGDAYYADSWGSYYTASSYEVDDEEQKYFCTDLSYAFSETNLEKMMWPATMWEVGTYALYRCSALHSFTLGSETNEIKEHAFEYCTSLSHIALTEKILYINSNAFANSGLTEVVIPNAVEKIDKCAFQKCQQLTQLNLGNGVTEIKEEAFNYCTALQNITFSKNLQTLGKGAFSDCSALTSITLPQNLSSIGEGAFSACTALKSIHVAAGNSTFTSIDGVLFSSDAKGLLIYPNAKGSSYQVPHGTQLIAPSAFSECKLLADIQFASTLQEIGKEAFYHCTSLHSISIPDHVTQIGESAFYSCDQLENATLSNGLTSIAEGLFTKCKALKTIEIPNGVTQIGYQAFKDCAKLTSVIIPATVNNIESSAFKKCAILQEIYCHITTPLLIDEDVFSGVNISACNLYVPQQSIAEYNATNVWKEFLVKEMPVISGVTQSLQKKIKINIHDGNIEIQNAPDSVVVTVYDSLGASVYQGRKRIINMNSHGLYIVKVGQETIKVTL